MARVADDERDRWLLLADFHIIIHGKDRKAIRRKFTDEVLYDFVKSLNEKYQAGIDPDKFIDNQERAGWRNVYTEEKWKLTLDGRQVEIAFKMLKQEVPPTLKIVIEAAPGVDGGTSLEDYKKGLRAVGGTLYDEIKRRESNPGYEGLDVRYRLVGL